MSILDFLRGRGLTKPGVVGPDGNVQFFDSPQAQVQDIARVQTAPETNYDSAPIPQQNDDGSSQPSGADSAVVTPGKVATPFQPTFAQAATDRYGNVTRTPSPALTKLGLFAKILKGGLQGTTDAIEGGALDAVPGRSAFGAGYSAAQQMPLVRQQRQEAAQKGQIENDMLQGSTQPVSTPWGQMPMWRAKQMAEYQKNIAETAKNNAQASKAEYIPIQGVGLGHVGDNGQVDISVARPQNPEDLKAAYSKAFLKAQQEGRDPMQDPAVQQLADGIQNLGKDTQPKQVNRDDQEIAINQKRAMGKELTPEEVAYDKAYHQYVKDTKTDPGLVRVEAFSQTRGMPVTDRQTGITSPMSWADYNEASKAYPGRYVTPQYDFETVGKIGTTKAFTTGKPAEELVAFNTAIQHADILEKAASALNNNDMRLLNSVQNKFKTEFGISDVTNFNVIANAYSREVTKALSAGHITDNEIKEAGATIPANASPKQILDAIGAYRGLMQSKVQMRKNQYDSGIKGKPNFGGQSSTGATSGAQPNSDGITFIPLH